MNFVREDVGCLGIWSIGSCAHPIPRGVAIRDAAHTRRSVKVIVEVVLCCPIFLSSGWRFRRRIKSDAVGIKETKMKIWAEWESKKNTK